MLASFLAADQSEIRNQGIGNAQRVGVMPQYLPTRMSVTCVGTPAKPALVLPMLKNTSVVLRESLHRSFLLDLFPLPSLSAAISPLRHCYNDLHCPLPPHVNLLICFLLFGFVLPSSLIPLLPHSSRIPHTYLSPFTLLITDHAKRIDGHMVYQ